MWEPAEGVARNPEGAHVALIGGQWFPVEQATKNAEGKFMVYRGGASPPGGKMLDGEEPKPFTPGNMATTTSEGERRALGMARALTKPVQAVQQIGTAIDLPKDDPKRIAQDAEIESNARMMNQVQAASQKEQAKKGPGISPLLSPGGALLSAISRVTPKEIEGATDLAMGAAVPGPAAATALKRIGVGALMGGGFGAATEPVMNGGDFATEKAKQAGIGALVGGGLSGVIEGAVKLPGLVKSLLPGNKKSIGATQQSGKPEVVTDELQRTRNQVEDGKQARPEGFAQRPVEKREDVLFESDYERLQREHAATITPLRDAAFSDPTRIQMAGTLKTIDALKKQNTDKKVVAALDEAKATIERAVENAGGGNPLSGLTGSQKSSWRGFDLEKALGKGGPTTNTKMLDETRQSINRLIEGKEGGEPLSGRAQAMLLEVQNVLEQAAPQTYRSYMDVLRKEMPKFDRFDPKQTVLGKTTSADRAAQRLEGGDAQTALENAFKGDRATRDMKGLMDLTSQNPQATQELRGSLKKYLFPADTSGNINREKAAERWIAKRGDVEASNIFEPKHFEALDKVMQDFAFRSEAGAARKAGASVAGWVLGSIKGTPGTGAVVGRAIVRGGGNPSPQQVDAMIEKAMADPATAQALAAPATQANIERALAIFSGREAAEQKPRPAPKPSIFGMKPANL